MSKEWVVKNSVSGKIYGKHKFSSAFECQDFIDKHFIILEYEFQRVYALENQIETEINRKKCDSIFETFSVILSEGLESFNKEFHVSEDINKIIELSLAGKKQKEIEDYIRRLQVSRFQSNNIIRFYNLSQERFADGFDF